MSKTKEMKSHWVAASDESTHRPNYLLVAIIFSIAVIVICFSISINLGILVLLILSFCFAVTALPRKHIFKVCIIFSGVVVILGLAGYGRYYYVGIKSNNSEIVQNMASIQLALDKYATEHDACYPFSIETLMKAPYSTMPVLPKNPFDKSEDQTTNTTLNAPGRMHPLSETGISRNSAELIGHFLYIPEFTESHGEIVADGYTLIGYGQYDPGLLHHILLYEKTAAPVFYKHITNSDEPQRSNEQDDCQKSDTRNG